MRRNNDAFFRIGEVVRILGVTRKTLLVYEEMGLLTPAMKDEESGFRYYTADNMIQIRSIRALQNLGLSLKEVSEYYYDTKNIDKHLRRLLDMRATLDKNIQLLQFRSIKQGDYTVHKIILPRQVCFCKQYKCKDVTEAAIKLRETYILAARSGKMSSNGRMFTMRMSQDASTLDLLCCIPVNDDFDGAERIEFPETDALCIYYRGSYENTPTAFFALSNHLKQHNIQPAGAFRSIYLEGPPNRGTNSTDYITQIAIPIKQ